MEVIVCSADGEVRGYLPAGEELGAMGGGAAESELEEDTLRELHQRKQVRMNRRDLVPGSSQQSQQRCTRKLELPHAVTNHRYTPLRTCRDAPREQELLFELRQYDEQSKKQSKGRRSGDSIP